MDKFSEMLQNFVNKDYDELLELANRAFADVYPACKEYGEGDDGGVVVMVSVLLSAIGADGTLTALEKKFLMDFLNADEAAVDGYIKMYDSRMAGIADGFVDAMSSDVKASTAILILCIMSIDEKISREETAFLRKILE